MSNVVVLDLLTKYLGEGDKRKDLNYAFFCPFCNHYKKKLEVDINLTKDNRGRWNCWVCPNRGKSVYSLLKKLNASSDDLRLLGVYKPSSYETFFTGSFTHSHDPITLPISYTSFTFKENDSDVNYILKRLNEREVYEEDIVKYKIGYLSSGKNKYNVVIPSYSDTGVLNYYSLKNVRTGEYRHPAISRDIVLFDFFIDWDEDVVIVEGMFDAFAVQRNVTPLLGKTLTKAVKERIVKSRCKRIYIALDGGEEEDIDKAAQYIHSVGKLPYKVDLPPGEDPSSIGKDEIWNYIKSAKLIDSQDLFIKNLKSKW